MSSPTDVVRRLYRAFAAGDVAAVLENVFMKLGAEWEGFSAIPGEFVSEGSTVVALGEYSATYRATGKSFRAPFAHVWKIDGDRVASFQQHTDTAVHRQPMQD